MDKEEPNTIKIIASNAAGKHPKVKPFVTGRNRHILFETQVTRRRHREDSKQVLVGTYNYETNKSVISLVDLEREEVLDVREVTVQFQLHPEEEKEAEELASKDQRIRSFLNDREMNPLTRLYFPQIARKNNTSPHRYAIVFLRPTNSERMYAVVDLSEQKVVDFFGRNGDGGGGGDDNSASFSNQYMEQ